MSQKQAKKARMEQKRKLEEHEEAQRRKAQMPALLKIYNKLLPGDYTRKQDLHHLIFMFVLVVILIGAIGFIVYKAAEREQASTSTELLIPATSFVDGQEGNVISMLEGYGFKNIVADENGNILGYGTPQMVEDYKSSYKDDILSGALKDMEKDMTLDGISSMNLSDDARILTVGTIGNVTSTSTEARLTFGGSTVNRIIYVCSNWCQIRNDGERLKIELVDATSTESEPYDTFTSMNGEAIIAEIEAREGKVAEALQEEVEGEVTSDLNAEK